MYDTSHGCRKYYPAREYTRSSTNDVSTSCHADADINGVFPLDRLRELAAEGVIGGVADKHLGFMGYTQQLRDLYERAAPEMAKVIERSRADAVLLTAG